jgi:hypothetical protein
MNGGVVLNGFLRRAVLLGAALIVASSSHALAQQEPSSTAAQQTTAPQATTAAERQQGERRIVGTVESLGSHTVVIRTDQGMFLVYQTDKSTVRKQPVVMGARVSVLTQTSDTEPAPTALAIDVLPKAQGLAEPSAAAAGEPQLSDPVPASVRKVESDIQRQFSKWHGGFQLGAALDPTLLSFTGFAAIQSGLSRSVQFRPGLEFAFGELTKLFSINLDGVYTLPGMSRMSKWAPYVGAGPQFAISHRNFDQQVINGSTVQKIDFGDWSWNTGLNFIVGARSPGGASFELKGTAWGAASVRLLAGYQF